MRAPPASDKHAATRIDPARVAMFRVAVALTDDGKLPAEFRLFAAGDNRTTKGTFIFDAESAESVAKYAAEWGNDFMIDYEHASLAALTVDPAEAGKAAGWFRPEVRDGALWATAVSWTAAAAEKLKAREYRYISPAADFETDAKTGACRITQLINCALTNIPATIGMEPLVASRTQVALKGSPMDGWVPMCLGRYCCTSSLCCQACDSKVLCASLYGTSTVPPDPSGDTSASAMQMSARESGAAWESKIIALARKENSMKTLLTALSLPETASEAEARVALTKLQDKLGKREEQHRSLFSLTGKDNFSEAVGIIAGWKQNSEQVAALSAEVTALKTEKQTAEAETLIANAKKDGRLAPAKEAEARKLLEVHGIAALSALISMLPKVGGERQEPEKKPGETGNGTGGAATVELSALEKKHAQQLAASSRRPVADVEKEMVERKTAYLQKRGQLTA